MGPFLKARGGKLAPVRMAVSEEQKKRGRESAGG